MTSNGLVCVDCTNYQYSEWGMGGLNRNGDAMF
jgi:hypothetical protein